MKHFIIGCGGVGSWLVPKLAKLVGIKDLVLVDGDVLEKKNLDRQLFDEEAIGFNKAEALAKKFSGSDAIGIRHIAEYYYSGLLTDLSSEDILWCCADNHSCRREVLTACDVYDCRAVFGANEYTDAEAYWYESSWRGSKNDPRVVYPIILTDRADDPLGPVGCTGQAQERTPQLVIANDWASGLMLHLFWFHTKTRLGLSDDAEPFWPVHNKINMFTTKTIRKDDREAVN